MRRLYGRKGTSLVIDFILILRSKQNAFLPWMMTLSCLQLTSLSSATKFGANFLVNTHNAILSRHHLKYLAVNIFFSGSRVFYVNLSFSSSSMKSGLWAILLELTSGMLQTVAGNTSPNGSITYQWF